MGIVDVFAKRLEPFVVAILPLAVVVYFVSMAFVIIDAYHTWPALGCAALVTSHLLLWLGVAYHIDTLREQARLSQREQ